MKVGLVDVAVKPLGHVADGEDAKSWLVIAESLELIGVVGKLVAAVLELEVV